MNLNLTINLIPFELSFEKVKIYYSEDTQEGHNTIPKKLLDPDKFKDSNKKVCWDLEEFDGSIPIEIDKENFKVVKNILKKSFRDYFLEKRLIVYNDFIDELILLEEQNQSNIPDLIIYKKFTVRIIHPKQQYACNKQNSWNLSISYMGKSEITKKSLSSYENYHRFIKNALVGKTVKPLDRLTTEEKKSDKTKAYVSNKFRIQMNWLKQFSKPPNKYSQFYNEVSDFYEKYIKDQDISINDNKKISIFTSGFQTISNEQIIYAKKDSNLLIFGKNRTYFSPYYGIKEYGPYRPVEQGQYRFFFIFHEDDKDIANKLYAYFTRGIKGFPGLSRFVELNIDIDKEKTIKFREENPLSEIKQKLESLSFDSNIKYLGIYISRIKKDDLDPNKVGIYYKLKELFLKKNITSQVIYRGNIIEQNFNYSLPNIGVAILAKLGGIPWRLSRPIENDLIIGVGAFNTSQNTYIGTTMTFKNDGTFVHFDSSKTNSIDEVSEFLKKIILSISKEDINNFKRIIIHYYKTMNKKESKIIEETLSQLNLKIPYIVLHITENKDYIPFDTSYNGKMPVSGTCVILNNKRQYLLCNNERYSNTTGAKIRDFPFPIQIKISKMSQEKLLRGDIKLLIDQIYQFSRMYWVSVKQKGKPVTVLYSEKIAKMTPSFSDSKLPDSNTAKQTLWFL